MQNKRFTFFKGRVALHAILKAGNIGRGDRVLLPGYTCVVVPNAIIFSGAEPVYLDIDRSTFNLDPNLLEDKLRQAPPGTYRSLIVQHTYGIPCDMDAISLLAERYNLLVIEDSCHAMGSTYKSRPVGSFGDAAFFSSQWSKPVTTGLGGWAEINNPDLLKSMESVIAEYPAPGLAETLWLNMQFLAFRLVYHPRLFWTIQALYRKLGDLGLAIGSSTAGELSCEEPGDYMKAMGGIQRHQLNRLLKNSAMVIDSRRRHARLIEAQMQAAGLPTMTLPDEMDPVYLRYPVLINNKEEVLAKARRQKVQFGDWFLSPVHPNLTGWETAGYTPGECPVAEDISKKSINISTDTRTSEGEITRTVNFLAQHADFLRAEKTLEGRGP